MTDQGAQLNKLLSLFQAKLAFEQPNFPKKTPINLKDPILVGLEDVIGLETSFTTHRPYYYYRTNEEAKEDV